MTNNKNTPSKAFKITQLSVLTGCIITGAFALGVSTSGSLQTVGMLGSTIPADSVEQAKKMALEQKALTIEVATAISSIIVEGREPTEKELEELDVNGDELLTEKDVNYILQSL